MNEAMNTSIPSLCGAYLSYFPIGAAVNPKGETAATVVGYAANDAITCAETLQFIYNLKSKGIIKILKQNLTKDHSITLNVKTAVKGILSSF